MSEKGDLGKKRDLIIPLFAIWHCKKIQNEKSDFVQLKFKHSFLTNNELILREIA